MSVDYAAIGTVPQGSVNAYQYQLSITNRNGYTSGAFIDTPWWEPVSANWRIHVSGSYVAASGNFDGNNAGYDIANNQVYVNGQWAATHTTLGYKFGPLGSYITGPASGIGAYVPYTFYGNTNDPTYIYPVSWSWYVNGTLVATTKDLEWQTDGPGSSQNVVLQSVDGNGVFHSAQKTMKACPGTQLNC